MSAGRACGGRRGRRGARRGHEAGLARRAMVIKSAPMSTLSEILLVPGTRPKVIADCVRLIEEEVAALPGRQREAFLLRYWEEFDVAETAEVMGCSEGSVKTHCSRAVHALAKALKSKGISL